MKTEIMYLQLSIGSIRHNAKFTGKSSFFGNNGRSFTVSKDEIVTFSGTARGVQ